MAGKIRLNVLFDMAEQAETLAGMLKYPAGFFIKTDVGYHRSGVDPSDFETIERILEATAGTILSFQGFLTHPGHTYKAQSKEEVLLILKETIRLLAGLKKKYQTRYPGLILSTGDTPSCSLGEDFAGIDEIRPGNFVYYDLMQNRLGSCRFSEIGAAVICPVVSVYPERNEALIYGGAVNLSKESLTNRNGSKTYGLIVPFASEHWQNAEGEDHIVSLSQEHGIFKTASLWARSLKSGTLVAVIPVHSCLAVNQSKLGSY
ncbi:MAG: alanine racemase [Bacteroidota bacterium]